MCLSFTEGVRENEVLLDTKSMMQDMTKAMLNEKTPLLRMKRDNTEEDDECNKLTKDMENCFDESTEKYIDELFGEGDGKGLKPIPEEENKPHYYARKTCNHLTASFECINLLEPCYWQRDVLKLQDIRTKAMLEITERIPDFNADKCPITKDYNERNSGYYLVGSLCLVAVSAVLGLIC